MEFLFIVYTFYRQEYCVRLISKRVIISNKEKNLQKEPGADIAQYSNYPNFINRLHT